MISHRKSSLFTAVLEIVKARWHIMRRELLSLFNICYDTFRPLLHDTSRDVFFVNNCIKLIYNPVVEGLLLLLMKGGNEQSPKNNLD